MVLLYRKRGFTIIEILISVALIAILTTAALPSLSQLYSSTYVRNAAKAFEEALRLGRIEASTRLVQTNTGSPVMLCPYNAAQTACIAISPASPAAWQSEGWMLFVDRNGNNDYNFDASSPDDPDKSDLLIHTTTDYAGKNFSISFGANPANNRIIFGMEGALNSSTFTPITITDANNLITHRITIDSSTGQTLRKRL